MNAKEQTELNFLLFLSNSSRHACTAPRALSRSISLGFFLRVLVHLPIRISISFYELTSSHSSYIFIVAADSWFVFIFIGCAIVSCFQYDMAMIQHVSAVIYTNRILIDVWIARDRHKQTNNQTHICSAHTSTRMRTETEKSALK